MARKVALKRAGRELKGLSPFKQEKTPSFFVNDQKGFCHCFASGEHGDIFKFVMKTEGLSFPEAVERLAEEAGVPMPKAGAARSRRARTSATRLYALLEASARFFEAQLTAGAGAGGAPLPRQARARRARRIAALPPGLRAQRAGPRCKEHLAKAGFTAEEMIASGMLIARRRHPRRLRPLPPPRHVSRSPTCKGRVIAFGGRALDPDAPAKYLNSPETPLFHKGDVLFNAAQRARPPPTTRTRSSSSKATWTSSPWPRRASRETVAPLGTALTEDQIKLLWRMAPEPILCFDGDAAGRRAAFRAVETVLPHLKPGFSVQFAFLPDGLDPDDLIRQQGPPAFAGRPGTGRAPLFDVLMEREAQRAATCRRPSSAPPWRRASRPWSPRSAMPACARTTSASCARRCGRTNRTVVREIARGQWPAQGRRAAPASGATTPRSTGACASAPAAGADRLRSRRQRPLATPVRELAERAPNCRRRARPC